MKLLTILLGIVLSVSSVGTDTTALIKDLCTGASEAIDMGDDRKALEYYSRCLDICGSVEPMFTLSSSLYNIAEIYYQNGEYDMAEDYINRSISIDSVRASDSVLALKYLLASMISHAKGDYRKAMEFAVTGMECSAAKSNHNITGRLILMKTRCLEALGGRNSNLADLEKGYLTALEHLRYMATGHYYGKVNPYEGEVLYHLGIVVSAQGKDGKPYLMEAARLSRESQMMRGQNPSVEYESYLALADIMGREGNRSGADFYSAKACSLSYVPHLKLVGTKLALSQMEFIRREKDRQIERQRERFIYSIALTSLFAIGLFAVMILLLRLHRKKMAIEEKNGQLVKLVLQKEALIKMVKEGRFNGTLNPGYEKLSEDVVPLPEIKLSNREYQVLELCCQGKTSKEMADILHLSVRTVDNHKANIFRKVGLNSTTELVAFALKSGLAGKAAE